MHSSVTAAIFVAALTLIGCFLSPELLPILLCGLSLAAGIVLLWPKDGVPMLLLPFALQWLSVAVKPITSVITNTSLVDLSDFGGNLEKAAIFSFIALIALAFGMRLGSIGGGKNVLDELRVDAATWPDRSALLIGISFVGVGHFLGAMAGSIGGLTEILLALSNITYCGLFILVYWTLRTGKQRGIVAGVALFEIAVGMMGFFGTFRTALFIIAIAVLAAQHRFKASTILLVGLTAVPALLVSVFWSEVKPEYRVFLNNDTQTQSVQQPISARIAFLSDELSVFDGEKFNDGLDIMLKRLSYIDFLSMVLDYVPANTPHENGDRTFRSMTHIFTPRIIFTNKPPLESDTEVTARYTGMSFSNYTYASISIGYLGEVYVDFGMLGACVFQLIFGFVIGWLYKSILSFRGTPMILNVGLTAMATIPICYFEQALIKTIGGSTATFIAIFLLQRLTFPLMLQNLLPGIAAQRKMKPMSYGQSTL